MFLQSLCVYFNVTLFLGHVSKQITWLQLILSKRWRGPYSVKYACSILKKQPYPIGEAAWYNGKNRGPRSKTNLKMS